MRIPVQSPWLPGYIDVVRTVLVILTMAGLIPDRPHSKKVEHHSKKVMEWNINEIQVVREKLINTWDIAIVSEENMDKISSPIQK